MTIKDEQETTVTWLRSEKVVRIYTSDPAEARRLRAAEAVNQVRGDETWGDFTVPITAFHPLRGFKRKRTLTDEQRKATGERLKKAREARK